MTQNYFLTDTVGEGWVVNLAAVMILIQIVPNALKVRTIFGNEEDSQ
jgi:hypothetical protein